MPLVSTSWARRGSLLAEEPTLEPHKHIHRCVSMRSDRPTEPRPPRWMKTEKSGGETENNHQANYHTITAGSCPHPSLSQIVGLSESTSDREERKTGEIYQQIHPQGSQLQPVSTLIQKPQHRQYRDALTKNKEEKRRIRNQQRHTKTESERWRDFFHEWSMQQHVVEIAAST